MRFIAILILMFADISIALSLDAPDRHPPFESATIAELRAWVEADRGFGEPETVEAKLVGLDIFIAWNCPFSGRNGKYSYTYVRSTATGRWRLIDSSFFERPETLVFAYVDALSEHVLYVGQSGRNLKSVSLKELRFK